MKILMLFALFTGSSHSFAELVITNGGWPEKWQNCYANEIKNVLQHSNLSLSVIIEDYEPKGVTFSVDYDRLNPAMVGGYFIVDLVHKTTGHVIRAMFKGLHDNHLSTYDPVRKVSTQGYYCSVNTNLGHGYTALIVFERDVKINRKMYLHVGGSGFHLNSQTAEVAQREGD